MRAVHLVLRSYTYRTFDCPVLLLGERSVDCCVRSFSDYQDALQLKGQSRHRISYCTLFLPPHTTRTNAPATRGAGASRLANVTRRASTGTRGCAVSAGSSVVRDARSPSRCCSPKDEPLEEQRPLGLVHRRRPTFAQHLQPRLGPLRHAEGRNEAELCALQRALSQLEGKGRRFGGARLRSSAQGRQAISQPCADLGSDSH